MTQKRLSQEGLRLLLLLVSLRELLLAGSRAGLGSVRLFSLSPAGCGVVAAPLVLFVVYLTVYYLYFNLFGV